MKTNFSLEFRSDPVLLKSVRALMDQYLSSLPLSPEKRQEIVLAVDEACTNAIRHAYRGCPDEKIKLLIKTNDTCLEITVADKGKPMPQSKVKKETGQEVAVTPESVQPGGLGLKLMRQIFDEVRIKTGEKQGNRIAMRLYMKQT